MEEIKLYDCPHCKNDGVLPMEDMLCPNCKKQLTHEDYSEIASENKKGSAKGSEKETESENETLRHKNRPSQGDWILVPMSGLIPGVVMAISIAKTNFPIWLLITGVVYFIAIQNPNFKYSWSQKLVAIIIMLLIGVYGDEMLVFFMNMYAPK